MLSSVLAAATVALAPADLECRDPAAVQAAWRPGIVAFEAGDLNGAKANVESILARCGEVQTTWFPRIMRAELAIREQDHEGALRVLEPVPKPAPAPIGSYSSHIALRALAALKREAEFLRVRHDLIAASAAALTRRSGPIKGRLVERFSTTAGEVQAIDAEFSQGAMLRRRVFLVTPKDPLAPPATVMLTSNLTINRMAASAGRPKPLFVDGYDCGGHTTVAILSEAPSDEALKKTVVDYLEGRASPVSSSRPSAVPVCVNHPFVTPGLDTVGR